jgi:hypothetical protein
MSSRSERYLANAEKCQRFADAAYTSGTKRLYGALASNWRRLAEEADWTDKIESRFLLDKIRQANFLRQIDKTEDAIQKFEVALEGEPLLNVQGAPSIAANQKEKEPQIRSLPVLALGRGTNDDRKVRKVNGSECTRGSQNAGRNASKIRELFQRRLANDWAKNGYFQYSVTRTVCEVFGTPRAVAIMGGHESGR